MSSNFSDVAFAPTPHDRPIPATKPIAIYLHPSTQHAAGSEGIFGMLFACVLSLAFANWLYPAGTLLGVANLWQHQDGDVTQYIAGFNAFVRESWHWPLLRIDSVNWPGGTLATFVDTIPLYAFILKLCAHGSDTPFRNPYGAWIAICYLLQGVGAWWVCREARVQSFITLAVMAVLLAAFPALTARIGHISLMSHWLIVFGLAIYLRGTRQRRLAGAAWAVLVFCAFYINIYIFSMVSLLFAADCLRRLPAHQWRRTCATAVLIYAVLGISLFLTMLPLQASSIAPEWGFGYYSMNLLAPFAGGKLLSALPATGNDGQNEGFNYVGVFVLALCVYALRLLWRNDRFFWRRHVALLVILLLCALYALSNNIYLGKIQIVYWPMPDWTTPLTSQLRASGRFFWPVGYALTIFTVIAAHRLLPKTSRSWILSGVAVLQLWDLQPVYARSWKVSKAPLEATLNDTALQKFIGKKTKTLYFYPPFRCNIHSIANSLLPTMLYASRHELNLSTAYVARASKPCDHYEKEIGAAKTGDTAFIFAKTEFPDIKAVYKMLGNNGAGICIDMGATYVCRRTPGP